MHDLHTIEWVVVKVRLMGVPESLALAAPGQVDARETLAPGEMAGVTSTAVLDRSARFEKASAHSGSPRASRRPLCPISRNSAFCPRCFRSTREAELLVPRRRPRRD